MPTAKIVFLFDVDNTLLDNDRVTADLKRHLEKHVGADRAHRYWELFEAIRSELGYADYLGALQRYRIEYPQDPHLLTMRLSTWRSGGRWRSYRMATLCSSRTKWRARVCTICFRGTC